MKITIPRYKLKVELAPMQIIYAVVCQYKDRRFGFADFWDLPYTAKKYEEVSKMRNTISKWAKKYGWLDHRIKVAKISR